jgi:hypothetical protein
VLAVSRNARRGQPASLGVPARRPPHPATSKPVPDSLGISQTQLAEALGVARRA